MPPYHHSILRPPQMPPYHHDRREQHEGHGVALRCEGCGERTCMTRETERRRGGESEREGEGGKQVV